MNSRLSYAEPNTQDSEVTEHEIPFAKDLKDGDMRALQVGTVQILISRYNGELYATGNSCPHRGAPMNTGLLVGDKLICPWHAASFNIVSGALEQQPSIDGLPSYRIEKKQGKDFVYLPKDTTN